MFWAIFGFCIEIIIFAMIIISFKTSVLLGGLLLLLWLYVGPGSITYEFASLDQPFGKDPEDSDTSEPSPLLDLIGKEGKTVSVMRPEGTVVINEKKYHTKTRLDFMAADLPIRVIDAKHKTLIVEELIRASPKRLCFIS